MPLNHAAGADTLRTAPLNDTPHETLGKDTTPRQCWERGRDLRFPTDDADLYRRFVVRAMHKVSNDHVIKADGRLWEAPRGCAASWVEVARHVLDGRLWVPHKGLMIPSSLLRLRHTHRNRYSLTAPLGSQRNTEVATFSWTARGVLGYRQIGRALRISHPVVSQYARDFTATGLSYAQIKGISDSEDARYAALDAWFERSHGN